MQHTKKHAMARQRCVVGTAASDRLWSLDNKGCSAKKRRSFLIGTTVPSRMAAVPELIQRRDKDISAIDHYAPVFVLWYARNYGALSLSETTMCGAWMYEDQIHRIVAVRTSDSLAPVCEHVTTNEWLDEQYSQLKILACKTNAQATQSHGRHEQKLLWPTNTSYKRSLTKLHFELMSIKSVAPNDAYDWKPSFRHVTGGVSVVCMGQSSSLPPLNFRTAPLTRHHRMCTRTGQCPTRSR